MADHHRVAGDFTRPGLYIVPRAADRTGYQDRVCRVVVLAADVQKPRAVRKPDEAIELV
jgi:hypothetical protein